MEKSLKDRILDLTGRLELDKEEIEQLNAIQDLLAEIESEEKKAPPPKLKIFLGRGDDIEQEFAKWVEAEKPIIYDYQSCVGVSTMLLPKAGAVLKTQPELSLSATHLVVITVLYGVPGA